MLSKIVNLFFLLALAAAAPVPGTEADDGTKYAQDKGAGRSVLLYVLGGAGCLVVLGVLFFAYCKHKRGERVFPMQKKPKASNVQQQTVEMNNLPTTHSYGRQRTVLSQYGTDNPYGWPARPATPVAAVEDRWLQDYTKPLPRLPGRAAIPENNQVRMPAPVAQPPTHVSRKPVPGAPLRQVFQDKSGYYR